MLDEKRFEFEKIATTVRPSRLLRWWSFRSAARIWMLIKRW